MHRKSCNLQQPPRYSVVSHLIHGHPTLRCVACDTLSCRLVQLCKLQLWMGTHHTSPSKVDSAQISLLDHLRSHPELIGRRIIENFDAGDGNLPFLFKVLSIEKALSVQAHPSKEAAEKLHRQLPDIYKGASASVCSPVAIHPEQPSDANHKPEMVIALTPFTALCGFRPLPQIAAFLESTPEFASLVPPTMLSSFRELACQTSSSPSPTPEQKSVLKSLFSILMTAPPERTAATIASLIDRYSHAERVHETERDIFELVVTLNSQFPGDIGIFCAFTLNYIKLEPGEAIFLGAGEPHAYISGG
jgi:mannose-6-phosphate isomerase